MNNERMYVINLDLVESVKSSKRSCVVAFKGNDYKVLWFRDAGEYVVAFTGTNDKHEEAIKQAFIDKQVNLHTRHLNN